MNAPAFTPGPWKATPDSVGVRTIIVPDRKNGVRLAIATIENRSGYGSETYAANARFIEALPELYAALAYAVDNPEFDSAEFDRMARAALAKAVQS